MATVGRNDFQIAVGGALQHFLPYENLHFNFILSCPAKQSNPTCGNLLLAVVVFYISASSDHSAYSSKTVSVIYSSRLSFDSSIIES